MRFDCKTTKDTKYRKTKQGTNTKPHKQCEQIAKLERRPSTAKQGPNTKPHKQCELISILERTQSVAKQNKELTQNPTNNGSNNNQ